MSAKTASQPPHVRKRKNPAAANPLRGSPENPAGRRRKKTVVVVLLVRARTEIDAVARVEVPRMRKRAEEIASVAAHAKRRDHVADLAEIDEMIEGAREKTSAAGNFPEPLKPRCPQQIRVRFMPQTLGLAMVVSEVSAGAQALARQVLPGAVLETVLVKAGAGVAAALSMTRLHSHPSTAPRRGARVTCGCPVGAGTQTWKLSAWALAATLDGIATTMTGEKVHHQHQPGELHLQTSGSMICSMR